MKLVNILIPSLFLFGCGDEQLEKLLSEQSSDADLDGVDADDGDCDDSNAGISPFESDIYGDGIDQNCDGVDGTDFDGDGVASTASGGTDCDDENPDLSELVSVYIDNDGDGFGSEAIEVCSTEDGYALEDGDCDDENDAINPDAEEVCDGADNNCDAQIDEGALSEFFEDTDGDGFGTGNAVEACEAPDGYVTDNTDFDDSSAAAYPGATEICDGIDNDGENGIDDGVLTSYYLDADGDGFGTGNAVEACEAPDGHVTDNTDFNDNSSLAFPGAIEICDGIDNDGQNGIDDGVLTSYYLDADGDGFGAGGGFEACAPPTGHVTDNTDFNDNSSLAFPGATEICDGIDNDGENGIDDGVLSTYYLDADGDGFGAGPAIEACEAPDGHVTDNTDFNDNSSLAFPGATEICDGIDNDGENGIDDGVLVMSYSDTDNDGFGDSSRMHEGCSVPLGYVVEPGDCADLDPNRKPDAEEICDGIDNNCDTLVDDDDPLVDSSTQQMFYADQDGDGFGNPDEMTLSCTPLAGTIDNDDDCDDTSQQSNPIAQEIANDGIDQDCNGFDLSVEAGGDYFGEVDINSDEEAAAFCGAYDSVWGSIEVGSNGMDPSSLECLDNVDGSIQIHVYEDTELPNLSEASSVLAYYHNKASLSLPSLEQAEGMLLYNWGYDYYEDDEVAYEDDYDGYEDSYEDPDSWEPSSEPSEEPPEPPDEYYDDGMLSYISFDAQLNRYEDQLLPFPTEDVRNAVRIMFYNEYSEEPCLIGHYVDSKEESSEIFEEAGSVVGWTFGPSERSTEIYGDCDWVMDQYGDLFEFFANTTVGVGLRDTRYEDYNRDWMEWYNQSVGMDLYFEGSNWDPATLKGTGAAYHSIMDFFNDMWMEPMYLEDEYELPNGEYFLASYWWEQVLSIENLDEFNFESVELPEGDDIDNDRDGYTELEGDCDDSDSSISPADKDGDGVSGCDGDCDDNDIYSNLMDWDNDGFSSCDGDCFDFDPTITGEDQDGDGISACDGDCDDNNADVYPGAAVNDPDWLCSIYADNDGYGDSNPDNIYADEGSDCDDSDANLNNADEDEDGYSTCNMDCDDSASNVYPYARELISDGIDNNCNSEIDEHSSLNADVLSNTDYLYSYGIESIQLESLSSAQNIELFEVQELNLAALEDVDTLMITGQLSNVDLANLQNAGDVYIELEGLDNIDVSSLSFASHVYVTCQSGTFDGADLSSSLTDMEIDHYIEDCNGELYELDTGNSTGEPSSEPSAEPSGEPSAEPSCPELVNMNPEQGSFNVHYQEDLYVVFSGSEDSDPEATVWLETNSGDVVDGEVNVETSESYDEGEGYLIESWCEDEDYCWGVYCSEYEDYCWEQECEGECNYYIDGSGGLETTITFEPSERLESSTRYSLMVDYCGSDATTMIPFETSIEGSPVQDELTGNLYGFDLSEAEITKPSGLGELLSGMYEEGLPSSVYIEIAEHDGNDLTYRTASEELCNGMEGVADFTNNPSASFEFNEFAHGETIYNNGILNGEFTTDGMEFNGSLSTIVDYRTQTDLLSMWFGLWGSDEESAYEMCDLLLGFGVECEPCPTDGEPLCVEYEYTGTAFLDSVSDDLLISVDECAIIEQGTYFNTNKWNTYDQCSFIEGWGIGEEYYYDLIPDEYTINNVTEEGFTLMLTDDIDGAYEVGCTFYDDASYFECDPSQRALDGFLLGSDYIEEFIYGYLNESNELEMYTSFIFDDWLFGQCEMEFGSNVIWDDPASDNDGDGYSNLDGDCDDNDSSLNGADLDGDGWSDCDGDCNDEDPEINPERDDDGDGVGACDDCDDLDPMVHSLMPETCDGIDNNCDGLIDDDDPLLEDGVDLFWDIDGDGYGDDIDLSPYRCEGFVPETSPIGGDCNDLDAMTRPYAGDTYGDGIDQDCDGLDCLSEEYGSAYYTLCPQGETLFNAESICVEAGYDGLVSILTEDEHNDVRSLIEIVEPTVFGEANGRVWIGLYGSSFEWYNGAAYSYDGMFPGGDDDGMNYWRLMGDTNWEWNDTSSEQELNAFICEIR